MTVRDHFLFHTIIPDTPLWVLLLISVHHFMILLSYVVYFSDTILAAHSQSLPSPTESEYLLYPLRLFLYLSYYYSSSYCTYNRLVLVEYQVITFTD